MDLEALGNIGEFAGAVGMLITLIYLAVQVRQHNRQVQRNESNVTFDQLSSFRLAIATDRQFAELFNRGIEEPDSLDAVDKSRHSSHFCTATVTTTNRVVNPCHYGRLQRKIDLAHLLAVQFQAGFFVYTPDTRNLV